MTRQAPQAWANQSGPVENAGRPDGPGDADAIRVSGSGRRKKKRPQIRKGTLVGVLCGRMECWLILAGLAVSSAAAC